MSSPSARTPDTVLDEELYSPRSTARHNGVFARLVPFNDSARLAFSTIVDDVSTGQYHRQFMHINPQKENLSTWQDSEDEGVLESQQIWSGYYLLSLDVLPNDIRLGWIMGSGRKDRKDRGVDLLLTLDRRDHQVSGRHARLTHHRETGVLMLHADGDKVVVINATRVQAASHQVFSMESNVTIGVLSYKFEYTGMNEPRYRAQLETVLCQEGQLGFVGTLSTTPSEQHFEFQGYSIQAPFAYGSYGMILAGTEITTGKAVAVKRVRRTNYNRAQLEREIAVYKALGNHPHLCALEQVLYSSGDANVIGTSVNDVYLIQTPLARETLHQISQSEISRADRVLAVQQILDGICHMHHCGIIHRDLKPTNIMAVTRAPLKIIIIDFGTATFDKSSKDHKVGTIQYLAPEVIRLKRDAQAASYNWSVDIWAIGLCVYLLFFGASLPIDSADGINETAYAELLKQVSPGEVMSTIVQKMLAWDSLDRPSARTLRHLPMFAAVLEDKAPRKRALQR